MPNWQERVRRLARSPYLRTEIFGREQSEAYDFPLYALTFGAIDLPAVYVAAGVHGDEPEGVEAALQLLESIAQGERPLIHARLIVLPCLNPSGLALRTRANEQQQDINRQFHADTTPVTTAVRRFISPDQTCALVDLHTDHTATGFYFFELLQADLSSYAPMILGDMVQGGYPLEELPFYAGCLGKQGLIAPTEAQMADFERLALGASLSQWTWRIGVPVSCAFEAPGAAPKGRGTQMHLTALRSLFTALEDGAKAD